MPRAATLLLAMLLALTAAAPPPDDLAPLPGLKRLTLSLTVPGPSPRTLQAFVIRPAGAGPFPLVMINHGMPRAPTPRTAERPQIYTSAAIAFAQRGYAAVIVMRSGYGGSAGPFLEALGPCADRNYQKAGEAAANEILAALDQLRTLPWIDPTHILLLGHSMGGFAILAAAAHNPPDVLGTISFAGAVGSPSDGFVCQPDRLVQADRVFGQATHIPSLWIFAHNDGFFGPALAQRMFDAYTASGAPASLDLAPDIARDGHLLIFAPPKAAWWPAVASFLTRLNLPTQITVPLPPPVPLPDPTPIDEAGNKAFATYNTSQTYEKAFAVDPAGHYGVAYGWPTIHEAETAALHNCQIAGRICRIYAGANALMSSP